MVTTIDSGEVFGYLRRIYQAVLIFSMDPRRVLAASSSGAHDVWLQMLSFLDSPMEYDGFASYRD